MSRKLAFVFFCAALLAFTLTAQSTSAQGESERRTHGRILHPIDEQKLFTLKGNTRPEVNARHDRGPVEDHFPLEHMLLLLRRSPEQEQALQQFIDEVHDPKSPNFHHWLSAEEFGARFGVAREDLVTIRGWLESYGFRINVIYPNGMMIDFSGTAGFVRRAFHTEIHRLEIDDGKDDDKDEKRDNDEDKDKHDKKKNWKHEKHFANVSDPQIPAALAPVVSGIVSLHDFRPHTMHVMRGAPPRLTFGGLFGDTFAVTPSDLATIYNLNPLFNAGISGQGQTIALIEDTDVFTAADWNTFRSTLGLSGYSSGSFNTVHPAPPSGPNNCGSPGIIAPNDAEAILDAEWASAAAPSAAIVMAACADTSTTFGGLIALQNLINSSQPPSIVSISYGQCETVNGAAANAAYNSTYQQAVAQGMSVFVAAGDSGAAACDNSVSEATHGIGANAFASTPYNVAVGGTDFSDTFSNTNSTYWNSTNSSTFGSARSYIPEIPWNDSCAGVLLSTYVGFSPTYGSTSLCNDSFYGQFFQSTVAGGGGPSGCATGAPSISGVVSGTCQGWPKPSWQTLLGNPNDGVRDTPDVSLFAADGLWSHYYVFCWSDTANGGTACTGDPSGWSGAGGTSFSAPILAGIQALVNQKTANTQGNPNANLYRLAALLYGSSGSSACNASNGNTVDPTCTFYDVTQGDIDVNCTGTANCYRPSAIQGVLSTSNSAYNPAYGTSVGWDFATGIGTLNATNLVNNWHLTGSPLLPPTLVSATASSFSEVDLVWTNPAGSSATGNVVMRCNGSGCTPTIQIASLSATDTSFADTTVAPSTTYTYLIRATGLLGSADSNALSVTTPAAPLPLPPTVNSATAVSPTEIDLAWTNNGTNATGIRILRCLGNSCTPTTVIVTLSPSATTFNNTGLTALTTYTYIVEAFNSTGVADSPKFSQTTLAPPPPTCPCTIWSSTAVPAIIDNGPDSPVELGLKFRSDTNGIITGVRFYKSAANTGTHVANLWSSTGTLLATANFVSETASGWQQVVFSAPVAITANTTYVVSYHTNVGHWSVTRNYFATTGFDNPPLHALANGISGGNGVNAYGSTSVFPTSSFQASNYWVDVVFVLPPTIPLQSITVTPSNPTIPVGATQPFNATGQYLDGSTQIITSLVAWSSSNSAVAPINSAGQATAQFAGNSTISATLGGISGNSTVTVAYTIWNNSAVPVTIDGGPDSPVELGLKFRSDTNGVITGVRFYKSAANTGTHVANLWSSTGALLATATFANETPSGWQQLNFATPFAITANTTYVVSYHTNVGHWSVDRNYFATTGVDSPPLHALANGISGGNGVNSYGSTSVFPTSSFQASNYWVDVLFVVPPPAPSDQLLSITLTPTNSSLRVGATQQFNATGNYQSGATQNLNTMASWASSNPSVASISTVGLVTTQAVGSTTISASFGGLSASTSLSVALTIWSTTAVPALIDNGPDSPVELGLKFQSDTSGVISGVRFFKSAANTGTHVANLWSSAGTLLASATFVNETPSGWQQVNFATPVAITANTLYVVSYHTNVGHWSVTRNYFATTGFDSPPLHALANGTSGGNGVSAYGSTSVFPTSSFQASNYWVDVLFTSPPSAPLQSIAVAPGDPSIPVGGTQAFNALGHYQDGSTQVISSLITWNSSNTLVAPINAFGLATAQAIGSTTISASFGGLSASTSLTVAFTIWNNSAVPVTIDGGPDSPVELGLKFRSDTNGLVTGVRFYKSAANTGTHVANLWSSTGTLLATATFVNETPSGWQQVNFATPVAITANTTYVVSYHTNVGHWSVTRNYFATAGFDNPPLHALANGISGGNGVNSYGSTSVFPTSSFQASNYWVDVLFH